MVWCSIVLKFVEGYRIGHVSLVNARSLFSVELNQAPAGNVEGTSFVNCFIRGREMTLYLVGCVHSSSGS